MTTKPTLLDLADAPSGMTYIAIGPFCWGKGITAKKAVANAKKNLSRSYLPESYVPSYHVMLCPTEAYVNDMGGINRPKDSTVTWCGAYTGGGKRNMDAQDPTA